MYRVFPGHRRQPSRRGRPCSTSRWLIFVFGTCSERQTALGTAILPSRMRSLSGIVKVGARHGHFLFGQPPRHSMSAFKTFDVDPRLCRMQQDFDCRSIARYSAVATQGGKAKNRAYVGLSVHKDAISSASGPVHTTT